MELNIRNSSIQKAMAGGSQEASVSLKKKKEKKSKINVMPYTFYSKKKNGAWAVTQW